MRGHQPPTQALFGENICKNERIWSCWGGVHQKLLYVDPPLIRLCVPHTCHLYNTLHRGQNSTARHVQLVTELHLIFNKLEVSRLHSTLSVFVIIFVLHTLSESRAVLDLLFSPICPVFLTDKINLFLVLVYKSNVKEHFLPD